MAEEKKRLAVLVGCNYPNSKYELHGCINDVLAMHDVLVSQLGFCEENIQLLIDDEGSKAMPTGSNIRRVLMEMIVKAQEGDVLFFHYSGHGTLIPGTAKSHGHHGRTRRDEAIVPCDFNLITDVDFRQLVDRLPIGASLTIISDSCHSGGLIDKEKEQIGPSVFSTVKPDAVPFHRIRFIPFESVLDHLASISGIDSVDVSDHLVNLFGSEASDKFTSPVQTLTKNFDNKESSSDDGILLSGCQTDETSADMSPEDGVAAKAYGAFSNAVQMVLKEHGGVITNRQLVMKARALLVEQGFTQHPCLYCSDENADALFLWQKETDSGNRGDDDDDDDDDNYDGDA